ncbi:hypothetical protein OESDEN_02420 [Oesophagostomum dentatum]|uniref:Uncharacterized protein n=1 Tax=Oesophagostomum dentatum TaxID=61180 RepID=A0A0B1TK36_OESDE|nr:hypothetical protein OESDEN_02420 [Oesophagostomum dentatum]
MDPINIRFDQLALNAPTKKEDGETRAEGKERTTALEEGQDGSTRAKYGEKTREVYAALTVEQYITPILVQKCLLLRTEDSC